MYAGRGKLWIWRVRSRTQQSAGSSLRFPPNSPIIFSLPSNMMFCTNVISRLMSFATAVVAWCSTRKRNKRHARAVKHEENSFRLPDIATWGPFHKQSPRRSVKLKITLSVSTQNHPGLGLTDC